MRTGVSLTVLAAASGVAAFWRMECRGRVGLARIDPLVSPGEVAQHAHAIHGSAGFNEKVTYEDLVDADCTSCAVTQDMSSYWHPALYFKHANGSYELVNQVGGMLAYYFLQKDLNDESKQIKAFPDNFRMIAGDTFRRNYSVGGLSAKAADPEKSIWAQLGQTTQADLAQRSLGFNCLNYNAQPEGSLYRHYMPEKEYLDQFCADGIRIEIMFPSCWNGKDLDSPNHRDHVAYPDGSMTGFCPKGFDVKLPGLFYETIWDTAQFRGDDGEFVVSNGDIQGFGYHADFISGWKEEFLQKAVDTCTNMSGKIEDCPIFSIQSEDKQRSCSMKVPSVLRNEKVVGNIGTALPGNVQIAYGPGPATNKNPAPQTTTVEVPTATYQPGATASESKYLPGGVFKELPNSSSVVEDAFTVLAQSTPSSSSPASPSPAPSSSPAPTSPPAAPPAAAPVDDSKYEVVRTDYVTVGKVVSMIIVKEAVEYVTVTTTTVTQTVPFKARRAAHLHRHHGRHGRHS